MMQKQFLRYTILCFVFYLFYLCFEPAGQGQESPTPAQQIIFIRL